MVYLLVLLVIVLWLMVLIVSFFLTEVNYSPVNRSGKARLLDSLHRVANTLQQLQDRGQRAFLFIALVCCLLSLLLFIPYLGLFFPKFSKSITTPVLVTCRFAPLIYLSLLTLLQVAGEICQALTERRHNSSATLMLNSYFWLPLLLAWSSLAAYLPVDSSHVVKGAASSMWLGVIQPTGCLAFATALIGPYLLINARPPYAVSPVHNWIRELRMVIGLLMIVPLIYGQTCFSPVEADFTLNEIARIATQISLPLILIGVVFRLKVFLRRQEAFDVERLWKVTMWMSCIALTASFFAFHVLGNSDPLMHVLLNFSLLAIWVGFIAPKCNLKQSKTISE